MSESDAPARLRLPDRVLPDRAGGPSAPLRQARHGTVLVLLGSSVTRDDRAFLQALTAHHEALRAWDGRVLLIAADVEASMTAALDALRLPFPVLLDAEKEIATAADVRPPALVITDQYGEAYVRQSITAERPWPTGESIEQWLRFLAIRCAG